MRLVLPFEEAQRLYPEAVRQAEAKLRKGRSKSRKDPLESFEWAISWGVQGRAYSFAEVLSGQSQQDARDYQRLTLDEKVADYASRCGCVLEASKGRGWWTSEMLPEVPQIVLDQFREQELAQEAERTRIEALTPEERQREIDEALGVLQKDPGFMVIRLPKT